MVAGLVLGFLSIRSASSTPRAGRPLWVRAGGREHALVGSYESGAFEDDGRTASRCRCPS